MRGGCHYYLFIFRPGQNRLFVTPVQLVAEAFFWFVFVTARRTNACRHLWEEQRALDQNTCQKGCVPQTCVVFLLPNSYLRIWLYGKRENTECQVLTATVKAPRAGDSQISTEVEVLRESWSN